MGHNTTAAHLVHVSRQLFCRTAIPEIVWSDGGPQFTSKRFQDFSKQWGFTHVHQTSSPHYPQSNGKTEATVKSMKRIISTSWSTRTLNKDKLGYTVLQYRNTPSCKDGLSPAQKLYGRPIQNTLQAHRRSFAPEWQCSAQLAEQQAAKTLQQAESYYNSHAHRLPDLQNGSMVALQNPLTKLWDIYGTIVEIGPNRQYYIKTQSGRVLVCNHRFLHHRTPASLSSITHSTTASQPAPSLPELNSESHITHTTTPEPTLTDQ